MHRPLLAAAVFFVLMRLTGVAVPDLPIMAFVLPAAWAAARSSPRLHG